MLQFQVKFCQSYEWELSICHMSSRYWHQSLRLFMHRYLFHNSHQLQEEKCTSTLSKNRLVMGPLFFHDSYLFEQNKAAATCNAILIQVYVSKQQSQQSSQHILYSNLLKFANLNDIPLRRGIERKWLRKTLMRAKIYRDFAYSNGMSTGCKKTLIFCRFIINQESLVNFK